MRTVAGRGRRAEEGRRSKILATGSSLNVRRFRVENQEETMNATMSKKSGKGLSNGVVSELTVFLHVKPGHVELGQLHTN
jgi:hypothetical protein